MIDRFNGRRIYNNTESMYDSILEERNVKHVQQYETAQFYVPSPEEYLKVKTVKHIWSTGDRYYKLAGKYYGDPRDWWLIAKFNNKPTEADIKVGDTILVPSKIEEVKRLFKI